MQLRFLHLSDIHFGQEKDGTLIAHDDVRAEVLSDCKLIRKDGLATGSANAIIVTGDIAYSGEENEFKRAIGWLEKVAEAVGCGQRSVIVIPGNHDVDLGGLSESQKIIQKHIRTLEPKAVQAFLTKEADQEGNPLLPKFRDYRSFAQAYGSDFKSVEQPITIKTYDLEGGKGLRLIGLCSVLISDRSDKKKNMILGTSQFIIERDPRFEDVYMVHHPLDWFMDEKDAAPYFNSRARVLMTGHEHKPDLSVTEPIKEWFQLRVAAGALNPPNADDFHNYSYNWLEFWWAEKAGRKFLNIKVCPRIWNRNATCFEADEKQVGDKKYKILELDCGPAESKICPSGPPENPALIAATQEVTAMPPTNPPPADIINQKAFEILRFLFWRYLDRETRKQILESLSLLPASKHYPTFPFERRAFELASEQNKLRPLWDAIMEKLPVELRQKIPSLVRNSHAEQNW